MRGRGIVAASVVLCVLFLLLAHVCGVELKPTEPGTDEPAVGIRPPPPPPPDNPLVRAIRTIEVGEPIWCKGLGVFPLLQRRVTDDRLYLTLDEALKRGELVVKEVGSGSVPRVSVRNNSDHYVFLVGNEVLVGGKQNRMLREDLLLRPQSGEVLAEVFCVERGRWHNPDMEFRKSEQMVDQEMRRRVAKDADQGAVWEEVDRFARERGVSSRTSDLSEMQADTRVAADLAEYERAILPKLPPETAGLVAVRGPVILGADIFANEDLFGKLRRKLIQSYALTKVREPHIAMVMSRRQVEDFLRRCYHTHYSDREAPDVGRRVRLQGGGITGMGLSFRDSLVHVVLFAEPERRPAPEPEPIPRPIVPRRPPGR